MSVGVASPKTIATVIITVLLIIGATGSIVSHASQTIIRVPQDYPTLQEAIDNAPNGSTIILENGTYNATGLLIRGKAGLTITCEDDAVIRVNASIAGIRVEDSQNIVFRGVTIAAEAGAYPNGDLFNVTNTSGFALVYSKITGPSRYAVAVHGSSNNIVVADDNFTDGVWSAIVYVDSPASIRIGDIVEGKAVILVKGRGASSITIYNVTLTGSTILFMLENIGNLTLSNVHAPRSASLGQARNVGDLTVRDTVGHGDLVVARAGNVVIDGLNLSGGMLSVEAENATLENVTVSRGTIDVRESSSCRVGAHSFTIENVSVENAVLDIVPALSGPSTPASDCTLYVVYRNVSVEVSSIKSISYAIVDLGYNWKGATIVDGLRVRVDANIWKTPIPILHAVNALLKNVTVTGRNLIGIHAVDSTLENVSVVSNGSMLEGVRLEDSNATGLIVENAEIGIEYSCSRNTSMGTIQSAKVEAQTGLLVSGEKCGRLKLLVSKSVFRVSHSFIAAFTPAPAKVWVADTRVLGAPASSPTLVGTVQSRELRLNLANVEISGLSLFDSVTHIPGSLYLSTEETTINSTRLIALSGVANISLDLEGASAIVFLKDTMNITIENYRAADNVWPASMILLSARHTLLYNFTLSGKAYFRGSSLTIEYMTAGANARLYFDNHTSAELYLSQLSPDTIAGEPKYLLLSSPVVEYEYNGSRFVGVLGNYWGAAAAGLRDYNGDGLLDLKPITLSPELRDYWALASPPTHYGIVKVLSKPPSLGITVYRVGNAYVVEARAYSAYCTAKPAKLYVNGKQVKTIVMLPRTWIKLSTLKPGDRVGIECNYEWANTTVPNPVTGGGGTTASTTTGSSVQKSTQSSGGSSSSSASATTTATSKSTSAVGGVTSQSGWRLNGYEILVVVPILIVAAVAAFLALSKSR